MSFWLRQLEHEVKRMRLTIEVFIYWLEEHLLFSFLPCLKWSSTFFTIARYLQNTNILIIGTPPLHPLMSFSVSSEQNDTRGRRDGPGGDGIWRWPHWLFGTFSILSIQVRPTQNQWREWPRGNIKYHLYIWLTQMHLCFLASSKKSDHSRGGTKERRVWDYFDWKGFNNGKNCL